MLSSYIGRCLETGGLQRPFKPYSTVRLRVGALPYIHRWQSDLCNNDLMSEYDELEDKYIMLGGEKETY